MYEPIADAPPCQGHIPVNLRPVALLAATAGPLLDRAAAEDTARWPDEADREHRASLGTFAARAVTAAAESIVLDILDREPHRLAALLPELTPDFTAEVQAAVVHTLAAAGCLMLREAAALDDPSAAAEVCLSATRHLARAVTVASMDLDDESEHAPAGGGPA